MISLNTDVLLFHESLNREMQSKQLDVLSGIGMLIKLSRGISLHTFWAMQILKQYKTNLNQFVVTLIIRSLLNFPLMVVT